MNKQLLLLELGEWSEQRNQKDNSHKKKKFLKNSVMGKSLVGTSKYKKKAIKMISTSSYFFSVT